MTAPATEPQIETTIQDGYIIDVNTGEVLGIVGLPKEEFVIDSQEAADWVFSKMLEAESELAAVLQSPHVLHAKAIINNAAAIEKEKRRRIEWLHARFDNELGRWARPNLKGKTKTVKSILGSVSFRLQNGGLRCIDAAKGLIWAKLAGKSHTVKTEEKFLVSELTDTDQEQLIEFLGWYEAFLDASAFVEWGKDGDMFVTIDDGPEKEYVFDPFNDNPDEFEDLYYGLARYLREIPVLTDEEAALAAAFFIAPDEEKVTVKTGVQS